MNMMVMYVQSIVFLPGLIVVAIYIAFYLETFLRHTQKDGK